MSGAAGAPGPRRGAGAGAAPQADPRAAPGEASALARFALGPWPPLLLGLLALALAPLMQTGLFNVDETLYLMAVDAMARDGAFAVGNGHARYGSDALLMWYLSPGPEGPAPQYPPGVAVLGAPLYALAGVQGVIGLNALAGAASLPLTRDLALRLFGDRRAAAVAPFLLAGASFWVEYVYGIWPHAAALALALAALTLAIRAMDGAGPGRGALCAFASGLAVGAGMLFRLDAVLILAPIGAGVLLWAPRPWRMLAAGIAGMAPPVLALALINDARFGTFNPLSYGRAEEGVDLTGYLPLAGAAAVGLGLLLVFRRLDSRRGGMLAAGLALAAAVAVAAEPALQRQAMRVLRGAQGLLWDARLLGDRRQGITEHPTGVLIFWGLLKKALGQSLPWAGVIAALPFLPLAPVQRRGALLGLLACAAVIAPFLPTQWHGGYGSNMRYFMPVLPVLAAMAGLALARLAETVPRPGRLIVLGLALGWGLEVLWAQYGPAWRGGAAQMAPQRILLAAALSALAAGICMAWAGRSAGGPSGPRAARALGVSSALALLVAAAGIGAGARIGLWDLTDAQARRAVTARTSAAFAQIPERSIALTLPEYAVFQIPRPEGWIAMPLRPYGAIDGELLESAAADGISIWVAGALLDASLKAAPGLEPARRIDAPDGASLVELVPR